MAALHRVGFAALVLWASAGWGADPMRTLEVFGEGQVEVVPDIAYVQVGVTTVAEDVAQAAGQNAERVERVLAAVADAGVDQRDMATGHYSVSLDRSYGERERDGEAYRVNNMVEIAIRDLSRVGRIMGAAMAGGANEMRSLRMELEDPRQALVAARQLAAQDAREKAEQLAALHGAQLGAVLEIAEEGGGGMAPLVKMMASEAHSPPIRTGTQRLGARLRVVYQLF